MEAYKNYSTEETPMLQQQWRKIYLMGGYAALLSFCGTLIDIIYGSISSANLSALPQTAIERFAEFHQNWILGLYHLDLLNVITAIIMVPAYFALFGLHRKKIFHMQPLLCSFVLLEQLYLFVQILHYQCLN
jgi:hypothetical protein